jgi:hypothetical protein
VSRLELGGYEGPIPNIALPDPNLSADLPIQSLVLEDGVPFEKTDWVALGYTHYEVWCIGAAGGQGASAGDTQILDLNSPTQERIPDDLWAKMKAKFVSEAHTSVYVVDNNTYLTSAEYFEYLNPTHMMRRSTRYRWRTSGSSRFSLGYSW